MSYRQRELLAKAILTVAFFAFLYVVSGAFKFASRHQISTDDGIYTNRVTTNKEILQMARTLSAECDSDICRAQRILDYVTSIPYKINNFNAHSPQKTIQLNYGDCDDKSNLLISMLHSLGIESYFVLVPRHIFVIARLDGDELSDKPFLMIDKRKFYILESTAKNSKIGFDLRYRLDEIATIVEPFSNEKVTFETIEYREQG